MHDISDRKAKVREVQKYLYECSKNQRFSLPSVVIDGEYGGETRKAVEAFQNAAGLPETGKVDLSTFCRLRDEAAHAVKERSARSRFPSGEKKTLCEGSEGGDVLALHGVLSELSRFYPEIPAFSSAKLSIFHEETKTALTAMQNRFCTEECGECDPAFYERLCLELRARKEIDRIRSSE